MEQILLILQHKYFSSLEKIVDIFLKLNKQQIIDTQYLFQKKMLQLQYICGEISKRICKLNYIYDDTNIELSNIPKLIRDTIEEDKQKVKIVRKEMNDMKYV